MDSPSFSLGENILKSKLLVLGILIATLGLLVLGVSIFLNFEHSQNVLVLGNFGAIFCLAGLLINEIILYPTAVSQKRTEKELRDSEELYRITLNQISDAVLITDSNGIFTFIGSNVNLIFGYTASEIYELKNISILFGKEDWDFLALKNRGEVTHLELEITHKLGEKRLIFVTIKPVSIKAGTLLYTCHDITERKHAKIALKDSEERFRATFEQVAVGVAHLNLAGKWLRVNQRLCNIFGYSHEELLELSFQELTHPNDQSRDIQDVCKMLAGKGCTYSQETRYLRKDKTWVWVNLTMTLVLSQGGKAKYLISVMEDISDRKRDGVIKASLLRRNQSLIEALGEIVYDHLVSQNVMHWEGHYPEVLGYSAEEIGSDSNSWLSRIHAQDLPKVLAEFDNAFCQKRLYDLEYRLLHKDGSYRWVHDRGVMHGEKDGKPEQVIGVLRDITHRKESEEALKAAKEQLQAVMVSQKYQQGTAAVSVGIDITEGKRAEQESQRALVKAQELNELKTKFIDMASHEFRTPLTSIMGFAELLELYSEKFTDDKKLKYLQNIKSAAKEMKTLIDNVLSISRAEAGKLQINPVPFNLIRLAQELVEELKIGIGKENPIELLTQGFPLKEEPILLHLDGNLLRHILANLLSNAIKYSPSGSPVQFYIEHQKNQVIFQIKDQGIGIPAEDQSHLFESFHRAKNTGKISGTGLGLHIVKKYVELHQGQVLMASAVGMGTTFRVCIPLLWETEND